GMYELKVRGATDAQLENIRGMEQMRAAREKLIADQGAMLSSLKAIEDTTGAGFLKKLELMDTVARRTGAGLARGRLEMGGFGMLQQLRSQLGAGETMLPQALESRTAASLSAIAAFSNRGTDNPVEEMKQLLEQIRQREDIQVDQGRQIIEALRAGG